MQQTTNNKLTFKAIITSTLSLHYPKFSKPLGPQFFSCFFAKIKLNEMQIFEWNTIKGGAEMFTIIGFMTNH